MRAPTLVTLLSLLALGCGSPNEHVGTPCAEASECYPDVSDKTLILGTATCLTKYPGGYCTHTCTVDTDCCATPGECKAGFKQVCAPFENQPTKYCFLSCDPADIAASPNDGTTDPTGYCGRFVGDGVSCRSTGGGSENRRFCG